MSEVVLPGFGEMNKECGEVIFTKPCANCGELHYQTNTCRLRGCPWCWRSWRDEEAGKVLARLMAYRWNEPNDSSRRMKKVTVRLPDSMEPDSKDADEWLDLKTEVGERLRRVGCRAGLVVFHPYALTERAKQEADGADGYSRKRAWQYFRDEVVEFDCDLFDYLTGDEIAEKFDELVGEYLKWDPHYHGFVFTKSFDVHDALLDYGWEFDFDHQRVPEFEVFGRNRDESPFACYEPMLEHVLYLLNHAGIPSERVNKKTYSLFGELAPCEFNPADYDHNLEVQHLFGWIEMELDIQLEWDSIDIEDDDDEVRADGELALLGIETSDGGCSACGADACYYIAKFPEYRERLRDTLSVTDFARHEAVYELYYGDLEFPPGLKNPRTEDELDEALDAVVRDVVFDPDGAVPMGAD